MRTTGAMAALLALPTLVAACAGTVAGDPKMRSLQQVEQALYAYHAENEGWPADLEELRAFAASRGRPLDLGPFAEVRIVPRPPASVWVGFTTPPPESLEGGYALTILEVEGR